MVVLCSACVLLYLWCGCNFSCRVIVIGCLVTITFFKMAAFKIYSFRERRYWEIWVG